MNAVLFHHPRPGITSYLQRDSSGYGIGGVLYRDLDDHEPGVVGFANRSLRGAELNFTTTEKELLVFIFCLKKFRTYILGTPLVIRTDHHGYS